MLKDLGQLRSECESSFKDFNIKIDRELPEEFKSMYSQINRNITFDKYTATLISGDLSISIPNQWFFMATHFTDFYLELIKYKNEFLVIFDSLTNPEKKVFIQECRDNGVITNYDEQINVYFSSRVEDERLFRKFLTDYTWWLGSKTIDRNDFYISPILALSKVVQVSQGYIADITREMASNSELVEVLKEIDTSLYVLSDSELGGPTFPYKNILLKGVPGTGKSHLLNKIIVDEDKLNIPSKNHENVLRINVHSASSNGDLMQGIGISTDDDKIIYQEKKGIILNHISKAIKFPKQAFVIILEEIQENSLNELIGDLIYLIEPKKRAKISYNTIEFKSEDDFINNLVENNESISFIEVPYLVSTETKYKKMILPDNLFIFCTSNYRDDKKVIEDNLLRRFDVIEIYPEYKDKLGEDFENQDVSDFLKVFNEKILNHFVEEGEIHPDRFVIGHANWLDVNDKKSFCNALLSGVTDFKDIKDLDFKDNFLEIIKEVNTIPFISKEVLEKDNYKEVILELQKIAYEEILN